MKFSELTIDMFRMLQALEREPVNLATQTSKQGTLVSDQSAIPACHHVLAYDSSPAVMLSLSAEGDASFPMDVWLI